MKIATITPTRGDRPQFFDFARVQLDNQTVQPDTRLYMAYEPENGVFDLTQRVRKGVAMAKNYGAEAVVIWEDDDNYPSDYIETLLPHLKHNDFVGFENTFYYNIKNKTWMHQAHPKRSSLFCTAFKLSAIEDFLWPADHFLWLDIRLWEHARDTRKKVKFIEINPCTGIKHGHGLCAGKSHNRVLEHSDKDLSFLKSRVEDYQFEFYSKLKL